MKRILFLGGSNMQISAIEYAKSRGYYAICTDYFDDSPGHKIAHESHKISTTDNEAVLELAKKLKVDAIIAYASDPAAPTASYVSEKLGLIANPDESVLTLARKDKFRDFLTKNNFNVPEFEVFEEIEALKKYYHNKKKIVLKPVDSSGSKGVSVVKDLKEIDDAFKNALNFSRVKKVIAEEFIEKFSYQIAGDGFIYNSKLVFRCFANEHFNKSGNILVPIGESFPYIHNEKFANKIHDEVQRLITLLGMKLGPLNFDIMISDDKVYLMEIGPRNGGNIIPEMIKHATGIDLIHYTIEAYLGHDCSDLAMKETNGFYSSYMINSLQSGILSKIVLDEKIRNNIIEIKQWIKNDTPIKQFTNASQLIGVAILKFDSKKEMIEKMDDMSSLIKVLVN